MLKSGFSIIKHPPINLIQNICLAFGQTRSPRRIQKGSFSNECWRCFPTPAFVYAAAASASKHLSKLCKKSQYGKYSDIWMFSKNPNQSTFIRIHIHIPNTCVYAAITQHGNSLEHLSNCCPGCSLFFHLLPFKHPPPFLFQSTWFTTLLPFTRTPITVVQVVRYLFHLPPF